MSKRIASIDGWRAIAALGVLYTHTYATLHFPQFVIANVDLMRVLNLWGNGVQLFFVLSGFCFYLVFGESEKYINTSFIFEFWFKRWMRIAPAFYTISFFFAIIKSKSFPDFLYKVGFNFTFLQNTVSGAEIDAIFWSLAVECHFYILLPFIFIIIKKHGVLKVVISLVILCFILNLLHYNGYFISGDRWWYSIFNNIGHFAWGILIAHIYGHSKDVKLMISLFYFFIGFVFAYFGKIIFSSDILYKFSYINFFLKSSGPLVMTMGFAMMVYSVLSNKSLQSMIGNKLLSRIGKISYSFYLLHSAILGLVYYFSKSWLPETPFGLILLMIMTLVILLPLSYISFQFLEAFYFRRKENSV